MSRILGLSVMIEILGGVGKIKRPKIGQNFKQNFQELLRFGRRRISSKYKNKFTNIHIYRRSPVRPKIIEIQLKFQTLLRAKVKTSVVAAACAHDTDVWLGKEGVGL
jgi:hypothetical protein